jgi:hypothetical protein
MQNKVIESAVSRNKSLSLNSHNPREYGINKSGLRGSLWISTYEGKKYRGTRVQTTGETATILNDYIEQLSTSKYVGEHHGYKY